MIQAKEIYAGILEMAVACETIDGANRCEDCPLFEEGCIRDYTFFNAAIKLTKGKVAMMMTLADTITEEQEVLLTDEEWKWEAEAEIGNLKRCDPEE